MTILAEAPKIGPHIAAMKENLGAILHLDPSRLGIKATTTETLGFVGRREGIAAFATATVRLPARGPLR
jgi:2-C-methyl-D-erythritol 4-phosphate cytidylyltransferase/2-C-methyl-D-erythritol 2,4-cyclodiphosphate synthase